MMPEGLSFSLRVSLRRSEKFFGPGVASLLRLAFGVAAPTPIRCHKAEGLARGREIGPDLFQTVAEAAAGEVNPRTSWRASKEFRLQLVRELSRRALKQAIIHAGGAVEC